MSDVIGTIKTPSGKSYDVTWNSSDGAVYATPSGSAWGGWSGVTKVGTARSAQEAMRKGEAWGYTR